MNRILKHRKEEITMVARFGFMSLLVLGVAMIVGDASADFKISASAGTGASPFAGAPHWSWNGDGYVRRTTSASGGPLDFLIPLPFHGIVPPNGNAWSVQVMV